MSVLRKLQHRWDSPYIVRKIQGNYTYFLKTLDSIPIRTLFTPNRIKKFRKIEGVYLEVNDEQANPDPAQIPGEAVQVAEEIVPEETTGRVDRSLLVFMATRSHSKGKRMPPEKLKFVIELPRGKPKGF